MQKSIGKAGIFSVLALGLSACASGNSLSESAPSVPAVQNNEARLVFYRTQVMGAAIQPMVFVNGKKTDTCQPNKVFFVDVPTGSNTITAATENTETLTVVIGAGQTAYVECTISFGILVGRVDLKVVPRETGMGKVGALAFSGLYEIGSM